jgi:cytochrome c5
MKLSICSWAAVLLLGAANVAEAGDGPAIYDQNCGVCHNSMSPKLGDKAAWAPLIKNGTDALVASTIKGKGTMPPRGGHANLSDSDIQAAVEYMESKAQ